MTSVSASELRANIYRLLDQVAETGIPLEVVRGERTLRIVAVDPPSRLDKLVARPDVISGDPEDLIHLDWSAEWRP